MTYKLLLHHLTVKTIALNGIIIEIEAIFNQRLHQVAIDTKAGFKTTVDIL